MAVDVAVDVDPALRRLVETGPFSDIAPLLDRRELESTDPNVLLTWPLAPHILGHLYNHSLGDARFLWKRSPDHARQDPDAQAAHRLLQAMWNKDYQGTWQLLCSRAWRDILRPLVAALIESYRDSMLALMGQAYTYISVQKAAALLNLSEQEAMQVAEGEGWMIDGNVGMLKVLHKIEEEDDTLSSSHLEQLTQYVVHLEAQ